MITSHPISVITPVVTAYSLVYFLVAELVYKNQALYVYVNAAESGGLLWNMVNYTRNHTRNQTRQHTLTNLLACPRANTGGSTTYFWPDLQVNAPVLHYSHEA